MKGFDVLTKFMLEHIDKRKHSSDEPDRVNAFDLILKANQGESSKHALDDSEVVRLSSTTFT